MRLFSKTLAVATLAASTSFAALPVQASHYLTWQVSGVADDDLLNVRAYPSSQSRIINVFANEMPLILTGRCTKGLNLDYLEGMAPWEKMQAVRYRWCEVGFNLGEDDTLHTGWVYGKYLAPVTEPFSSEPVVVQADDYQ